jgi:hypothetical protein
MRVLLAAMAMLLLAGCTRSVEWQEEVPLNTGETIWVERQGSYRFGSKSASPLEFGFNAERVKKLQFDYRGKRYAYATESSLQLLAISPDGIPHLVIMASAYEFERCVRGSYVQLRPDEAGHGWLRKDHTVDSWLNGLPTNLLYPLPRVEEREITGAERERRNANNYVRPEKRRIDPTYDCTRIS